MNAMKKFSLEESKTEASSYKDNPTNAPDPLKFLNV